MLHTRRIAILLGLFITALYAWLAVTPPSIVQTLLKRVDYMLYDLRLNLLLPDHPAPHNPIVIVDIDEKSLQKEGRFPWPRQKLAKLVDALYQQGATVIAFDMLFPEPESNMAKDLIIKLQQNNLASSDILNKLNGIAPSFDYDAAFANALAQQNQNAAVILGIFFSGADTPPLGHLPAAPIILDKNMNAHLMMPSMQSYVSNIDVLQKAAQHAGALSVLPDEDGTIRRYSLLQRYHNSLYPALALEAVRLYLLENHLAIRTARIGDHYAIENIDLGNMRIATDENGRVFIPYLGPQQSFPYYSATDVMQNKLPPHQLQNALVFVGTSAVGLGDMRSTPVQSVYPGVEIHANIAEALFSNHFPYVPNWAPGARLVLLILLGVVFAILFSYLGPIWILFTALLTNFLIFFGSVWLWHRADFVMPIVLLLLLIFTQAVFNITYGFFTESRRRYELKRAFEQYVPAGRVEEIMTHPEAVSSFEGERKMMSVLFMDIRNFTSISEKLNIIELKKLLNLVLTEMTAVIFNHGGTVDKYVGDMVMAFWGAPLADAEHACHAVLAGLDMQKTIASLQEKLSGMRLPHIRVGIGINTGVMDVGDMGSTFRRAYTVLGDSVNLASRLESLTKYYGVGIIIGENTRANLNLDEFVFRELDRVRVKGKQEGIAIYEPLGLRKNLSTLELAHLDAYHKALDAYYHQDWHTAESFFAANNTVLLYQLYLSRIQNFRKNPPAADWDGVWEHHEK